MGQVFDFYEPTDVLLSGPVRRRLKGKVSRQTVQKPDSSSAGRGNDENNSGAVAMFKAVVEYGGYAQAADAIHKSQSTISYGVHKLQEQLGVQLLEVEGRKAVLTDHGKILLQGSKQTR